MTLSLQVAKGEGLRKGASWVEITSLVSGLTYQGGAVFRGEFGEAEYSGLRKIIKGQNLGFSPDDWTCYS